MEELLTKVLLLLVPITVIIYSFRWMNEDAKKPKPTLSDEMKADLDDYFEDADIFKEKYKESPGACAAIDKWTQKMAERAEKIKELYQKEGESEDVLDAFDEFEEDLNRGWHAMRKGRNPYDSDCLKLEDLPCFEKSQKNKKVREL